MRFGVTLRHFVTLVADGTVDPSAGMPIFAHSPLLTIKRDREWVQLFEMEQFNGGSAQTCYY